MTSAKALVYLASMSDITCFWLEPTSQAHESLRRYAPEAPTCPVCRGGYHDATIDLGTVPLPTEDCGSRRDDLPHEDPRWPAQCGCGYAFQDTDRWQHSVTRLYQNQERGVLTTLGQAPVGAMWDADWYLPDFAGPDGRSIIVRTPGGDWGVDCPSTSGHPWSRTGTPPAITARPSILFLGENDQPGYHGFLTGGVLTAI